MSSSVQLVANGRPNFSLWRKPPQGAETILDPADELIAYLGRATGVEVPEFDDRYPLAFTLHLDCRGGLEPEEFVFRVDRRGVDIMAATVQGMFHGISWFLETHVGVRWLWPGEDGEVVPHRDVLTVPIGTVREKPDFAWRAIRTGGAVFEALDLNTMLHAVKKLPLAYTRDFDLWCRRNRLGGLSVADGHRWSEIAPPEVFGEGHPEYYALRDGMRDSIPGDGKHGNQPCLSNDEVVDVIVGYARARFDSEPSLDAFSVSPNDGGHPCECERCTAIDATAEAEADTAMPIAAEDFDHLYAGTDEPVNCATDRAVTDRLFRAVNRVAKPVATSHPGKLLLTHLYGRYRTPPIAHTLEPNVIGQYCVMGNSFHDDAIRQRELDRLAGFSGRVDRLGVYEYYSNGSWPEVHRVFADLVAESVKAYHARGARYFSTQASHGFACNGINLYVLARVLWNVNSDWKEVLRDYCESGFGAAAASVRRYLTAFISRWKETRSALDTPKTPAGDVDYTRLYHGAFLDARRADLEEALRLSEDEATTRRIRFLMSGLEYTESYCGAVESTLALYDTTAVSTDARNDRRAVESGCDGDEAYFDRALEERAVVRRLIERDRGRYVVSDFWADYRVHAMGADERVKRALDEWEARPDRRPVLDPHEGILPYFETSGTPYDRGRHVGAHYRELILEGFDRFVDPTLIRQRQNEFEGALAFTAARFPGLIAEMRGLADSTGLRLEDVFAYNSFNAIGRVRSACSIAAVANRNGRMVLGGNADLDGDGNDRKNYFVHRARTGDREVIMLQWAGTLWPHGGMNSCGLACTSASAPALPTRTPCAGLPQHLGLHAVLFACADVPSALELLSRTDFLGKGQNLGLIDAAGNVAMVEKSASYQGVSQARGVTMCRTNHYFTREMARYPENRGTGSSADRIRGMEEMLPATSFSDAYGALKRALASHGRNGLCRHTPFGRTSASLILDPGERTADFCGGHPCRIDSQSFTIAR